ncbi:MAG: hypothetical protein ABIC18_02045 [Candidatus Omnitrophota bacterium]
MPLRKIVDKLLGKLLTDRKVITPQQLAESLVIQKEKGGLIGEIMIKHGFATEADIAQALTAQYGFPYLPLDNYEIDAEIIRLIPLHLVDKYLFIPVDKLGNNLSIVMANPLDGAAIDEIEEITGFNLQIFVSTSSDIRKAISKYYKISPNK